MRPNLINVHQPGEEVIINSRIFGRLEGTIKKYIFYGEWACSFIDPKSGELKNWEFRHEEIEKL